MGKRAGKELKTAALNSKKRKPKPDEPMFMFSLRKSRLTLTQTINTVMDNVEKLDDDQQFFFATSLIAFLLPGAHRDAKKWKQCLDYLVEEGINIVEENDLTLVETATTEEAARVVGKKESSGDDPPTKTRVDRTH